MAISSSGMKIFKIAFRDIVDNYWRVPIAHFPLQIIVTWHCFNGFFSKRLFLHFWLQFLNAAPDFRCCFEKWFGYKRPSKSSLRFSIHGIVFKIRHFLYKKSVMGGKFYFCKQNIYVLTVWNNTTFIDDNEVQCYGVYSILLRETHHSISLIFYSCLITRVRSPDMLHFNQWLHWLQLFGGKWWENWWFKKKKINNSGFATCWIVSTHLWIVWYIVYEC